MRVTEVYSNGNFKVLDTDNTERLVYQLMRKQTVSVGDNVRFTDYKFKIEKFVNEDGKPSKRMVIISFGFDKE